MRRGASQSQSGTGSLENSKVLVQDSSWETMVLPSVKEVTTGQTNSSNMEAKRANGKMNFLLPLFSLSMLVSEGTVHIQCESSHVNQSNQDATSGKAPSQTTLICDQLAS